MQSGGCARRQWTSTGIPGSSQGPCQGVAGVAVATLEEDIQAEGVTEVVTGKARAEYRWQERGAPEEGHQDLSGSRRHQREPQGQMIDPSRILGSRFVLTNKGGETLETAELKAWWILGGHRDPDAGLYATSSPTASLLGHNRLTSWRCSVGGLWSTKT